MLDKQDITIVFLFKDKMEYQRSIKNAESLERNEDFSFCVERERGQEIAITKNLGIDFKVLISEENYAGIEYVGNRNVIVRGSVPLVAEFRSKAHSLGVKFVIEGTVTNWPKKIVKEFVKRTFYTTDYKNIVNLSKFPLFVKTSQYYLGTFPSKSHSIVNNAQELSAYIMSTMHLTETFPMIVSDVIDIKQDSFGKKEYRCFISNQNVSSISRYLDYDTNYIVPKEVVNYALDFANAHKHLPACYVLDIAETSTGVDLVELNDLESSGRYAKNGFAQFLQFIAKV